MRAEASEGAARSETGGETTVVDWPEPTPDQIAMIARVLAPLVHEARAERAERRAAA